MIRALRHDCTPVKILRVSPLKRARYLYSKIYIYAVLNTRARSTGLASAVAEERQVNLPEEIRIWKQESRNALPMNRDKLRLRRLEIRRNWYR